jgi:putative zinc finger/helix-turn-helix YgiT family protein
MKRKRRFKLSRGIKMSSTDTAKRFQNQAHNCRQHLSRKKATVDQPFLLTWSDLPNVYVAGIQYEECSSCRKVAGVFPQLLNLSETLTRIIAQKPTPLSGPEIKYLRKHMRKKAADFAKLTGVSAEQVSRWENGHNLPERSADKLIRLLATDQSTPKLFRSIANLTLGKSVGKESYLLSFRQNKWLGLFTATGR